MSNAQAVNAAPLNTIMLVRIESLQAKCHPTLGDGRKSYENQEPKMNFEQRNDKIYVKVDRDEHGNGSIGEGGTFMTPARFRELQSFFGPDLIFITELEPLETE